MRFVLTLLASTLMMAGLLAQEEPAQQASPQEILQQAPIFGFGIKKGQAPDARKTDTAYRALMAHPEAVQQFVEVFENGNIHGKFYALCALHELDQQLFEKLAKRLDGKQVVRMRNGCCLSELTVKELIQAIRAGDHSTMPEFKEI